MGEIEKSKKLRAKEENGPTEKKKTVNIMEETPKLVLLVMLYVFQGLPFGLFLNTIPMLFKRFLTY